MVKAQRQAQHKPNQQNRQRLRRRRQIIPRGRNSIQQNIFKTQEDFQKHLKKRIASQNNFMKFLFTNFKKNLNNMKTEDQEAKTSFKKYIWNKCTSKKKGNVNFTKTNFEEFLDRSQYRQEIITMIVKYMIENKVKMVFIDAKKLGSQMEYYFEISAFIKRMQDKINFSEPNEEIQTRDTDQIVCVPQIIHEDTN